MGIIVCNHLFKHCIIRYNVHPDVSEESLSITFAYCALSTLPSSVADESAYWRVCREIYYVRQVVVIRYDVLPMYRIW